MFTANQIEELMSIINLQHVVFIAANIGADMLSDSELRILKQAGVSLEQLQNTPFEEMFQWGLLSMSIGNSKSKKLDYKKFKGFLQSQENLPFTPVESKAIEVAKRQASSDIRGLGNRIQQQTGQLLIEADSAQRLSYEKDITEATVKNIKNRGSISNLVSDLGHKTGDWARDFGRISDYVMHQAFEEGRASQIRNQHGGDALVYKKVFQSACKKCVSLYLTKGVGSEPVLFKISELQSNGTNIGRKVADWKPVVGPTHPWCRCMLVHVDPNYEWSEEDGDFTKPKQYERKVQRRSRVKITVGNRTESA